MEQVQTKTTNKRRKWRSKPGVKRAAKWIYGKDSELLLCIKIAGNFLSNIASIDVRNKYRAPGRGNDYTQSKKIELLKELFKKGGLKGNTFNPSTVEFAAICPNESGTGMADLRKAIEVWKPGVGWVKNEVTSTPKVTKSASTWRCWMAGANRPITITFEQIAIEHEAFCSGFFARKLEIIERFADNESGEIPAGFLIAAHLAHEACQRAKNAPFHRCYIYSSSSSTAICRVDLGSGRLMGFGTGNGWINPAAFYNM